MPIPAKYIITFQATYHVVQAEAFIRSQNIPCQTIPVPRAISSDCNMGIEVTENDGNKLKPLLKQQEIDCEFILWNQ